MESQVILEMGPETTAANPQFDTTTDTWAKDLVHGQTVGRSYQLEWTPVRNPAVDGPGDWDGLSGTVVDADLSSLDNPFFHPFGDDWEFTMAPDSAFEWMTARSQTVNQEYVDALREAKKMIPGFTGRNVIGVEIERNLLPLPYRVLKGDRVCVWGRWIVDTGHDDFHTEIHPPVLLVGARQAAGSSAELPNSTYSTIIGRPYMVAQSFNDGQLFTHLEKELAKVEIPVPFIGSTQIEAHPVIFPKPFSGVGFVNYIVRPPTSRQFPGDVLMARFHFTVRTGIGVQVANIGDAVMVYYTFNENLYKRADLPKKSDRIIHVGELKKDSATAGDIYIGAEIVNLFVDPVAAVWLERGIKTDLYNAPLAQSTHDNEVTEIAVSSLPQTTPVAVDDTQPFPIYGYLALEWQRPTDAASNPTGSFVRLRNNWKTDECINIESGSVMCGQTGPGWLSAQWQIEVKPTTNGDPVGEKAYWIQNRWKPDEYLNVESGTLVCGPIQPGWLSARWTLEKLPGTSLVRIRSVWQRQEYLNIQSGALVAGAIQPGWLSANWTVELVA